MLDIKTIREQSERVKNGLRTKGFDLDPLDLLEKDQKRKTLTTALEKLQHERNQASKEIGHLKKKGMDAASPIKAMRKIGEQIDLFKDQHRTINKTLNKLLLSLPNLPHTSVPKGKDEHANKILRIEGEAPVYDFNPVPHWDLGKNLGILEFQRAARMTGTGFPTLKRDACRLSRALTQFMLDIHTQENGYTEIEPPFLCNTASMTATGQLPKMIEEMYRLDGEDLWLIPTAEVPLTNFYREEIIQEPLPIYLTACTPCFRREAGAAGKLTRGLNRLHQFNKVELVKFVETENSYGELEKLLNDAESILQRLGLHYRILSLCTGDLSFAAAKTYDIEVWAPGQQTWLEVSSCSNFEDFQARRANIRYRDAEGKACFPHTLNGSGLALPRLLVALMENGQEKDSSILLPEAIWPYMGGQKKITNKT